MMIGPVDYGHAHLFLAKFLRRFESAKARPDDHDMRSWGKARFPCAQFPMLRIGSENFVLARTQGAKAFVTR